MVRSCRSCGVDISDRYWNAIYCKGCAKRRQQELYKHRLEKILSNYYGSKCYICKITLTQENTWISRAKRGNKICKDCSNKRVNDYNNSTYRKRRNIILERLGNRCTKCGISDRRVLQIDHIHANGGQDIKVKGGRRKFFKALVEMQIEELRKNYQLLCANCNWIKRFENREW